jgi:Na+/proline symporter
MSDLDWVVLVGTLLFIVVYGVWRTRGNRDMNNYLRGGNSMKWWTVGLSVMATQASAVTFLSTPGQAFEDGLRFVQFYFGMPLALVIISVTFIPIYYRLKVYTAYEYLENRFDVRTRVLGAMIFLVQRALSAGITIYAPAIILSSALGWPLSSTSLVIGVAVIVYTISGGTKAVSQTQKQQMAVMMGGMVVAGFVIMHLLPPEIGLLDALEVAGSMGRLNAISFEFDPSDRYNFWSGVLGGTFLFLSYFGTDQSQVQRYLTGRSITESRLGLMMNGLLKVPMQFFILFVGVLVFVFYQFYQPPLFFIEKGRETVQTSPYAPAWQALNEDYDGLWNEKNAEIHRYLEYLELDNAPAAGQSRQKIRQLSEEEQQLKQSAKSLVLQSDASLATQDHDYVFITFILTYFPEGLVGLLLAVILSAAMSSTASELNALSTTATVDLYRRLVRPDASESHYVWVSRGFTLLWGSLALTFALSASLAENLIELVNIIGSVFYGPVLGIFVVAFYIRRIQARAVFLAAILAQGLVIALFFTTTIGYLWLNPIGVGLVIGIAGLLQTILFRPESTKTGTESLR